MMSIKIQGSHLGSYKTKQHGKVEIDGKTERLLDKYNTSIDM